MKNIYIYLFLTVCLITYTQRALGQSDQPKREFRGVWIATVVNIDWPSQNNLSTQQQKQEFIDLLEVYQGMNFNAVVVQVRAAGDTFYKSTYEPWSEYLTGKEGKEPEPFYDPLSWMIDESHQRGFEFHAWFNPYRATFDLDTLALAKNHAFNMHREWMLKYGNRFYFNPGLPEVIDYTTNVIMEVVNSYDVDGVHFDDYFYPYKIKDEVFRDSSAFVHYGTHLESIEDWRRANVDSLVKDISDSIRSIKPWVQFGISPFGVWRNDNVDPKGSDSQAGQTTYDDLYADPLKWAQMKWVDYLVPQLYWSMDHPLASHRKLVEWWSHQQLAPHLYIGHGTYKVKKNSDKAWNRYKEIPNQIELTREKQEIAGSVFFSAKSLMKKHKRLVKMITRKKYSYQALPPTTPFVSNPVPDMPLCDVIEKDGKLKFSFKDISPSLQYIISYGHGKKKLNNENAKSILHKHYVNGQEAVLTFDQNELKRLHGIGFTYVDRYGNESAIHTVGLKKGKLIQIKPD